MKLSVKCVPPHPRVKVLRSFISAVDLPVAAWEDDSKARSLSKYEVIPTELQGCWTLGSTSEKPFVEEAIEVITLYCTT